MKAYIKILIIFIILILIVVLVPGINGEYIKVSKLYINEISANQTVISDMDKEYSDYIEIYNGYNYDIDLTGYYLSDEEYNPKKWQFPNVKIKSKSYIILFASSKNKYEYELHTNFNLSTKGETVTLTDSKGNIISRITYGEQSSNMSFGFLHGKYTIMNPTPGRINDSEKINVDKSNLKDKIIINEYITRNKRVNYNSTGMYYDWVELYNKSDKDIMLKNVFITDNESNLAKYKIPDTKIKSNDYLIIYLSGETGIENEIHANFKLSDKEQIIISNGKNIFDKINIIKLPDNTSYGLKNNKWYYFTKPTPGKVNDTAHFEKVGDYNGSN